jgi:hypothetical protein
MQQFQESMVRMGCDSTSLFCYSQPHRPLVHHRPLALCAMSTALEAALGSVPRTRRCSVSLGAVHLWSLRSSEKHTSVFPTLHQGSQGIRVNCVAHATNLWRPQFRTWGISNAGSDATSTGTQPQENMWTEHIFSPFPALLCSCFDGLCKKETQIKWSYGPFLLYPDAPCLFSHTSLRSRHV